MNFDELEKLAKAATKGDLDTAKDVQRGEETDCPLCGEGTVEMDTFANFDGHCMGVQFFGIGPEFGNYEAYFRACSPDTILALIASHRTLVAALKPFCTRWVNGLILPDDAVIRIGVKVGDLRVAQAALSRLEAPEQSK